jgi:hypothetical protein
MEMAIFFRAGMLFGRPLRVTMFLFSGFYEHFDVFARIINAVTYLSQYSFINNFALVHTSRHHACGSQCTVPGTLL